jgi:hypothetical protein
LRAIATELDTRGIPAARGGKWSAVQVSRLLERVNASTAEEVAALSITYKIFRTFRIDGFFIQ